MTVAPALPPASAAQCRLLQRDGSLVSGTSQRPANRRDRFRLADQRRSTATVRPTRSPANAAAHRLQLKRPENILPAEVRGAVADGLPGPVHLVDVQVLLSRREEEQEGDEPQHRREHAPVTPFEP